MADEKTDETRVEPAVDLKEIFGETPSETPKDASSEHTDEPETPSSGDSEEQDPKELQAKLDAVTKELARVRKGKAESSAEVQELREQLANIQGQLEVMSKTKDSKSEEGNRLGKYSVEQLLQGQTEWEDALADEREAMRHARAENDEKGYKEALQRSQTARHTLNAIRKEIVERSQNAGLEKARLESEQKELVNEITEIYESTYETFPELKDRESELWKAGNEIYTSRPKLMQQLGPLAELVAVSLALTENPKLLAKEEGEKKVKQARKALVEEINERAEQSLIKGKASPARKTVPDFNNMAKQDFDAMVHKIKMGG